MKTSEEKEKLKKQIATKKDNRQILKANKNAIILIGELQNKPDKTKEELQKYIVEL